MKKVTTFFLKLAVVLIGIPVLAFCIFLAPKIGNFAGVLMTPYIVQKLMEAFVHNLTELLTAAKKGKLAPRLSFPLY